MASTIQKLLRKSPPARIFSALHRQSEPNLTVPFTFLQPHYKETKQDPHLVSLSGSIPSEAEDVVDDDSRKVWADSTKKKRKRKMNKHKYQKLRKRLRRQT